MESSQQEIAPELQKAEDRLQSRMRRDLLAVVGMGGIGAAVGGLLPANGVRAQSFSQLPNDGPLKEWSKYIDLLRPASSMLNETWFPEDELLRAELYQEFVMNIAQGYFWYFQATPEHPDWMPFENSVFMLQPNPDAVYYLAPVAGDGVYRIVGNRGNNPVCSFGVSRSMLGTVEPRPSFDNYDASEFTLDEDGTFECIFSQTRPDGWDGDWRYLNPEAESLLLRQFSYNWGVEKEARVAIERLDTPIMKPRLTAGQIGARLDALLGGFVKRLTRLTLENQNAGLTKLGFNKMELATFSELGNQKVWPQIYFRCIYDLKSDEALILETEIPEKIKYWNVQLNN